MKILFYGDSITDMRHDRSEDDTVYSYGFGYPMFVAGELKSENPEKYVVINRGDSGNRIVNLYARIKADVWNLKPDVFSILVGVNDIWYDLSDRADGVDIIRYEKVYRLIIEDTLERLPDVKIVLIEPFILHGYETDVNFEGFSKAYEYAKVVEKLAKEYHLKFLPLQEKFNELAKKHSPEHYLYDGVHPNVAGAKLIADEWLKLFKKEIEK